MKNIDLSGLITSMSKSVEESVEIMKKEKSKVLLEEFECTLTLNAEIDEATLKKQQSHLESPSGLKFVKLKPKKISARLTEREPRQTPANLQPELGTLTIRAIFTPNNDD